MVGKAEVGTAQIDLESLGVAQGRGKGAARPWSRAAIGKGSSGRSMPKTRAVRLPSVPVPPSISTGPGEALIVRRPVAGRGTWRLAKWGGLS